MRWNIVLSKLMLGMPFIMLFALIVWKVGYIVAFASFGSAAVVFGTVAFFLWASYKFEELSK